MGQVRCDTDKVGIERLCAEVWTLAEKYLFQPSGAWTPDYSYSRIQTPSFEVSASVRPDAVSKRLAVAGGGGKPPHPKQIVFRFLSLRGSSGYWYLIVRYPSVSDELRWAKGLFTPGQMRRAFPVGQPRGNGNEPEFSLNQTQGVYVAPDTPRKDLRAQICLFLIRTGLCSECETATSFLNYLETTFRVPRVRGEQPDRRAVFHQVFIDVRNWHWPEHWRAWRKYIKTCIRWAAHRESLQVGCVRSRNFRSWPSGSIDEAAEALRIDRSYIYRLIRKEKVRATRSRRGRLLLEPSEVKKLGQAAKQRVYQTRLITQLTNSGKSYEAARKRIYRLRKRGLSLDEVESILVGSQE
jgi:excisionase family DNA binding protein